MEVQEIMTAKVITVGQDEPVTAAARLLRRWNLGALPVTDSTGRLRGVLTDRDIVLRCLALDNGRLVGMVTAGDLARREKLDAEFAEAMRGISANLVRR